MSFSTPAARRSLERRALVVVTVAALLATAAAASPADDRFAALARRFIDEYPALSPVAATQLGDHRFDGELDDVSVASHLRERELYDRFSSELDELSREELSRANQVDAALLRRALDYGLWRLDELREWSWNPVLYTGLSGNAVYGLLARDFAPLDERLLHVTERLEQLPRLLGQVREILIPELVPAVHAETAVSQNRGLQSILDDMVRPQLSSLEESQRGRLESAMAHAAEAIAEHQSWLEEVLLPRARGDARIGAERFDRKLAFALDSDLDRPQILARAEAEFERVREQMFEVARAVYVQRYPLVKLPESPGPELRQAITRAVLEMAYQEKPGREEIVDTARRYLEEVTEFVRDERLVSVPDDPIEIILMPEFDRGVSVAYCDSPGALDVGQKTFYAVAPLPEEWTEAQVDSFLREYNLLSIRDLTIHEAMPGHYLQLAHSNRYPSVLRALFSSGPFIEGWGVYAERLMVEAGYQRQDPLMELIQLKWYLRTVTNAIIDQKIHVDGMSRDEAMELMIEGGFQEEREAAGKWVRARLSSTQLSTYFVGFQELMDLRREVEERQGADFDLMSFHDRLLSFGSPPVRFVRALMLGLEVQQ